MIDFPKKLSEKLIKRKLENTFRILPKTSDLIDFSSNDYLGFSNSKLILSETQKILKERTIHSNGATGSRLISGNSLLYAEIEKEISTFHKSEEALIFNSGYDANLGFFSSVPQRGDIVLFDEYIHASIRDGIRLSNAKAFKFKHNDLKNLKEQLLKLSLKDTEVYVVTESVFSMDGDSPNLILLSEICKEYQARLIVDEAHAVGAFGDKGEGLVQSLGLEDKIFTRIITFGKAFGCHGAAILGTSELVSYLVNFARSFIYTTGLPPHSLATILSVYKQLKEDNEQSFFRSNSEKLKKNIAYFKTAFKEHNRECNLSLKYIESDSPIQCFIIEGNEMVKFIAEKLKEKGYNVKPILSPTVPKGQERLRFCVHSFNSFDELSEVLILFFAQYKN